jgi:hypothetical protein
VHPALVALLVAPLVAAPPPGTAPAGPRATPSARVEVGTGTPAPTPAGVDAGAAASPPVEADAGAPAALGDEVVAGPVALRPPAGFVPSGLGPRETAALAPAGTADRRAVHLALHDPARDAVLVISSADEALGEGPDLRDRLVKRTVDHFRDLGLDLRLAWATPGTPPAPAMEVAARAADRGRELGLLVAYVPAGERTYVGVFSAPIARFDALLPEVEASLRTLRVEPLAPPAPARSRRRAAALLAVAVGAAVSWALLAPALRRRRRP